MSDQKAIAFVETNWMTLAGRHGAARMNRDPAISYRWRASTRLRASRRLNVSGEQSHSLGSA